MCLAILRALAELGKANDQCEARLDFVNRASRLYHIPSALALSDCGTRGQARSGLISSRARCYTSGCPQELWLMCGGTKSEEG